MDVDFDDDGLAEVERNPTASLGHGEAVDRGFRKVMGALRAARDERDLYALKALRFEKLKGQREHERSLRINKQWRLIVELRGEAPGKRIGVLKVEDYH